MSRADLPVVTGEGEYQTKKVSVVKRALEVASCSTLAINAFATHFLKKPILDPYQQ